ncbi:MAG: DUF2127 domain-containing protein [Candidatus Nanopelagicales bacterium]|jgi:uncharacterized membrane protein (DUF2068 family)|nr:DUF2127 domain-containing protein [Candidatus Nanopelagicales bacterium]
MGLIDAIPSGRELLTAREGRWVLRRCARRGHVLVHLADPGLMQLTGPVVVVPGEAVLLRCLRCGMWTGPQEVGVGEVVGSSTAAAVVGDLPLPVRGGHGRRIGLLKLVALERFAKGLALISGALVAYQVASNRGSILAYVERLLVAFRPLGQELGVHLTGSPLVTRVEGWLGGTGDPVRLAGLAMLAYGVVQIVEGVGLWGGWRWAEYLAAVATSAFIPLEIYELVEKPTPLKAAALVVNIAIVVYLVYKGRLFGIRGGHEAFLHEVRDSTLPADLLRSLGRSADELTSTRIV